MDTLYILRHQSDLKMRISFWMTRLSMALWSPQSITTSFPFPEPRRDGKHISLSIASQVRFGGSMVNLHLAKRTTEMSSSPVIVQNEHKKNCSSHPLHSVERPLSQLMTDCDGSKVCNQRDEPRFVASYTMSNGRPDPRPLGEGLPRFTKLSCLGLT